MKQKHQKSLSLLQRKFIKQKTLKRNQRYLNVSKMNSQQHSHSVDRRKPLSAHSNVTQKLQNTFLDTTGILTERLSTETGKFKRRLSNSMQKIKDQSLLKTQKQQTNNYKRIGTQKPKQQTNNKDIKGICMEKMTSRDYHHNLHNPLCIDERLFNNYQLKRPSTVKTHDFTKYLGKNMDFAHHQITYLQYDAQKLYQKYYYQRTNMDCKFNYKTQKKSERFFFQKKRKQDLAATQLDSDKVQQAYESFTYFRKTVPVCAFYQNSGRQLPDQMELRIMSPNKDYWHQNNSIKRPKLNFSQKKMKNDLKQQRIENIKKKKKPNFQRNQLCDSKYFQIMGTAIK